MSKMLEISFLKLKNMLISMSGTFIIVLGIAIVFSSFWTYETYTKTVYEDQEELVSSYTQYGKYAYTAPVTKTNPLYPKGTSLDMGKPAYFLAVSPTLDVSFTYSLNATDSADLSIERETIIVATSKEGSGENQKIVWQKEFPVEYIEVYDIKDEEEITHEFSLNISEIQSMVTGVQDQLKYSPNTTIEIVTHINYKGEINGEETNGAKDFAVPLIINSAYYQMPEELEFSENTDTYKKYRVKKDPSLSTIKLPLSLLLLSTILVGMLIPCTRMSKVDPAYIEKQEKKHRYSPFKEFISKGKLPENRNSLMQVEISSLQDLVDVAVDMNARVINDTGSGAYFIIHNNVLYIFFDASSEESIG